MEAEYSAPMGNTKIWEREVGENPLIQDGLSTQSAYGFTDESAASEVI